MPGLFGCFSDVRGQKLSIFYRERRHPTEACVKLQNKPISFQSINEVIIHESYHVPFLQDKRTVQ